MCLPAVLLWLICVYFCVFFLEQIHMKWQQQIIDFLKKKDKLHYLHDLIEMYIWMNLKQNVKRWNTYCGSQLYLITQIKNSTEMSISQLNTIFCRRWGSIARKWYNFILKVMLLCWIAIEFQYTHSHRVC